MTDNKTKELAERLKYFNEWRMGASADMPYPKDITADLNEAIAILESLSEKE